LRSIPPEGAVKLLNALVFYLCPSTLRPVKAFYKAAVVNVVCLVLLYFVQLDLAWRSRCGNASSPTCMAHVASVTYLPFLKQTVLAGTGLPLQSPYTLDWFQVLIFVIVVVDAYYLLNYVHTRSKARSPS
jgi:hypothetical protein